MQLNRQNCVSLSTVVSVMESYCTKHAFASMHPNRTVFPVRYVIGFPGSSDGSSLGFSLPPLLVNDVTLA